MSSSRPSELHSGTWIEKRRGEAVVVVAVMRRWEGTTACGPAFSAEGSWRWVMGAAGVTLRNRMCLGFGDKAKGRVAYHRGGPVIPFAMPICNWEHRLQCICIYRGSRKDLPHNWPKASAC